MSYDIVTRLRGKEHGDSDKICEGCDGFCCHCELCDCCLEILEVCLQAADEIERLRAERIYLGDDDFYADQETDDDEVETGDYYERQTSWDNRD